MSQPLFDKQRCLGHSSVKGFLEHGFSHALANKLLFIRAEVGKMIEIYYLGLQVKVFTRHLEKVRSDFRKWLQR